SGRRAVRRRGSNSSAAFRWHVQRCRTKPIPQRLASRTPARLESGVSSWRMVYLDWVATHNSRHGEALIDVREQLAPAFEVFIDDPARKLCGIDFKHNETCSAFEYAFNHSGNLVRIGTVNESLGVEGLRCVLSVELSPFRFPFSRDVINVVV